MYVCVCLCELVRACMHACMCMCEVFSLLPCGSQVWHVVVRFGMWCPYLLICLTVSLPFNPVNNSHSSKTNYSILRTITMVYPLSSVSCCALPSAHSLMFIQETLPVALINSDFSLCFTEGKTGADMSRSLPKAFC